MSDYAQFLAYASGPLGEASKSGEARPVPQEFVECAYRLFQRN